MCLQEQRTCPAFAPKRNADFKRIVRPPARHLRPVGRLAGESGDDDGDGRHGAEYGVDGGQKEMDYLAGKDPVVAKPIAH